MYGAHQFLYRMVNYYSVFGLLGELTATVIRYLRFVAVSIRPLDHISVDTGVSPWLTSGYSWVRLLKTGIRASGQGQGCCLLGLCAVRLGAFSWHIAASPAAWPRRTGSQPHAHLQSQEARPGPWMMGGSQHFCNTRSRRSPASLSRVSITAAVEQVLEPFRKCIPPR